MREGTSGVEKIVSSIQVVGPSHWGIDLKLKGPSWELGIFEAPQPKTARGSSEKGKGKDMCSSISKEVKVMLSCGNGATKCMES